MRAGEDLEASPPSTTRGRDLRRTSERRRQLARADWCRETRTSRAWAHVHDDMVPEAEQATVVVDGVGPRNVGKEGSTNERHVALTGTVVVDEGAKLFRLYSKSSMYAFCVDPVGRIEHLYWGKALPPTDELAYLSFSQGPAKLQRAAVAKKYLRAKPSTAALVGNDASGSDTEHGNDLSDSDSSMDGGPPNCSECVPSHTSAESALTRDDSSAGEHRDRITAPGINNVQDLLDAGSVFRAQIDTSTNIKCPLPWENPRTFLGEWAGAATFGKPTKLLEFGEGSTGDYRSPSFDLKFHDGGKVCPFRYTSHRVLPGKPSMQNLNGTLPELYTNANDATTLVVTLVDEKSFLECDLVYTVFSDVDAIARRVVVRNTTVHPVLVEKLMSATVDFHTSDSYFLTHLSGSWANERRTVSKELSMGRVCIESCRGTSSHQHNPFAALSTGQPREEDGEVYGMALVYSGNFVAEADMCENGRVRLQMGINPSNFEWELQPNEIFESPECVLVFSDTGLTGMSHQFHNLFRNHLFPKQFQDTVCPVLINTWEAMYFDTTYENVMSLARRAARSGVEMLVVDDGWFGARDDASSSLGDWYVNNEKLPEGLAMLAQNINDLGMHFGLWVEPELVSQKSRLYQEHPDWILHKPDINKESADGDFVLDLTRTEVQNYLIECMSSVFKSANIEYVKWDMNSHITEIYSDHAAPSAQGKVYHKYCMGLYSILNTLTSRFPRIRFETCCGGGGRFDAGMLHYSPQIWTSDNTDATSRLFIQHGTSLLYPPSCISAHISSVPNHQTLRISSFKYRFLVSLFGSLGLELNIATIEEEECAELSMYLQLYKMLSPIIHEGDFYRLWNPVELKQRCAWMSYHRGRGEAVVAAFLLTSDPGHYLPRLRLRGLDPAATYQVEEIIPSTAAHNVQTGRIEACPAPIYKLGKKSITASGRTLMNAGLPIHLIYDGDTAAFYIRDTSREL